jgi:hypothetical protein
MTAAGPDASLKPDTSPSAVSAEVAPFLEGLAEVASAHEGDPLALLILLRQLEKLHRTIQDGSFRASLPSERSSLFRLLQDMEQSGGWPYIPRLQLRTFLDLLQADAHPVQPDDLKRDDLSPDGRLPDELPREDLPRDELRAAVDQVPEAA